MGILCENIARRANHEDGWLGELTLPPERTTDAAPAHAARTGRRASDLGMLPISLDHDVMLRTWTAQELRSGQRSTIPADLAAVLDHFAVEQEQWLDTVEESESAFGHTVGPADSPLRSQSVYLPTSLARHVSEPHRAQ